MKKYYVNVFNKINEIFVKRISEKVKLFARQLVVIKFNNLNGI